MITITLLDEYGEVLGIADVPDAEHALKNVLRTPGAVSTVVGVPPNSTARAVVGGGWVDRPVRPNSWATWNAATGTWGDARSLETARAGKLATLKISRDDAEYGGFEWDGSRFDSDSASQQRLSGAFSLAQFALSQGQEFSIDWTLEDNTVRTLTREQMTGVGLALSQHVATQHAISRSLKSQTIAAESLAQLDAITWPV